MIKKKIVEKEVWTYDFKLDGVWGTIVSYAVLGVFIIGLATTLRETFWLMYQAYKLTTGLL